MTAAEMTLYVLRRAAAGGVWRNEHTNICWMEHPATGAPTDTGSEFIHEILRAGFLKFTLTRIFTPGPHYFSTLLALTPAGEHALAQAAAHTDAEGGDSN